MIIEFGANNFLSFKEEFEISFELSGAASKKISCNNNISYMTCLKGKNGAGKTSVLQVLPFLKFINNFSFSLKPDQPLLEVSFFKNNSPTKLYIIFDKNEHRYKYELIIKDHKIFSETLEDIRDETVIFERISDKVTAFSDLKRIENLPTRANVGVINMAHQFGFEELSEFYSFFQNIIVNDHSLGHLEDSYNVEEVSLFYKQNPKMFEFCKDTLKKVDIGISEITLEERINSEEKPFLLPIFNYKISNGSETLDYFTQSAGTKKLYKSLYFYFWALESGGIAVIDELDLHIHPHLIPILFNLFEDKENNPKHAQLIFTSHLTEIIDTMGKYRTYIIDKEDSESYAYRLDEIEDHDKLIRNDRKISQLYDKGLLGGTPQL